MGKGNPVPDEEVARRRVSEEPDYVNVKRFGFSLARLKERYPDECPDGVVADAMMVPEDQVQVLYEGIAAKLRGIMGVG